MGYAIELSFDVRKSGNLVSEKQRRRRLATDNLCNIQYFMHEIEGHGKTTTSSTFRPYLWTPGYFKFKLFVDINNKRFGGMTG